MLIAFAVYDSKAACFGAPMFLPNKGIAIRTFSDVCADPASPMAKHPSDYSLHEIGSYDPDSGKLTDISPAVHILAASAVVALLAPAPLPVAKDPVLPLGDSE